MANILGLGVFGTFGQPYCFQQAFNADCHFVQSLDLNDNEIELFPGTELFAVKKEMVRGVYSVAFCIYTFVREMNANRNSTFLGSCIVLQGVYTEAEKIYKLLRELHTDLVSNLQNVNNNTIQVKQAVNLAVREPAQFQSIRFSAASIEDTPFYSTKVDTGKKYFVKTEHIESAGQIVSFFDEALKNYNDAVSLFFTFSDKVINDVSKKEKLSILSWDEFINHKNLVKEDFITTKPALKTSNIAEHADNIPVRQAAIAEHDRTGPMAPQPFNSDDPVIHNADFAFDDWSEPAGAWTIDEAAKRVHEYNRLLAYAKHLNARNQDLLEQKQKQLLSNITEKEDVVADRQEKQLPWNEIPINNISEKQRNAEDSNGNDDDTDDQPFYKKRYIMFVAAGALFICITGFYLGFKKHIFRKQVQDTAKITVNQDSVNAATQQADTEKPAEHPDVQDSNMQK